jgi:hypothetical protein
MSRIRVLFAATASLIVAFTAFLAGSPAALALSPAPDPGGPVAPLSSSTVTVTHGSPLWMFIVVAIVAMAVAAAVTLLAQSRLPAHRSVVKAAFR